MTGLKSVNRLIDVRQAEDLICLFDQLFWCSENTRLVFGNGDPVYIPANLECNHHRIVFANGFFASALHEIAHWCIAGKERRQQLDYGYWYIPDGRDSHQQLVFENVEIKPQSIEWIFAKACNSRFLISVDNLNGVETDSISFKRAVLKQVLWYCQHGLPTRAELMRHSLCSFYDVKSPLDATSFCLDEL